MKRAFDFTASLLGIALALPVLLVAMFAIRRETTGPAIFAQRRVGKNGREFTCYKLRTMYIGTGDLPTHMANSSAVTPLGVKLRQWKVDELAQLFNVLTGQMSLVGPRPCLPSQIELVAERMKRGVYDVRPGITGLAQINDIDMSTPVLLAETDARYVKTRSFIGDLRLLAATVLGRGRGIDRIVRT